MNIGSAIAIYFIVWWITLFAVLPFGVRSQIEAGEVVPGSEPGAPHRTPLLRIVLMNTVAATAIFALVYWLIVQQHFGLDDIPLLPKFNR